MSLTAGVRVRGCWRRLKLWWWPSFQHLWGSELKPISACECLHRCRRCFRFCCFLSPLFRTLQWVHFRDRPIRLTMCRSRITSQFWRQRLVGYYHLGCFESLPIVLSQRQSGFNHYHKLSLGDCLIGSRLWLNCRARRGLNVQHILTVWINLGTIKHIGHQTKDTYV